MLGAIYGDIAGSYYEHNNIKTKDFGLFESHCHFTDDSVMTLAVADALLKCDDLNNDELLRETLVDSFHDIGWRYPKSGYGGNFARWLSYKLREPYNSFGNGSAMRVSPVVCVAKTLEEAERLAKITAEVTHNHPEGIKGAVCVAGAGFLAKSGASMEEIKEYVSKYYEIDFTLDDIRPTYTFDVTCPGSVPQALESFFESTSLDDTVKNAISIGGDSDTVAAIAGSVAAFYYGFTGRELARISRFLDSFFLDIIKRFHDKFTVC